MTVQTLNPTEEARKMVAYLERHGFKIDEDRLFSFGPDDVPFIDVFGITVAVNLSGSYLVFAAMPNSPKFKSSGLEKLMSHITHAMIETFSVLSVEEIEAKNENR